jgi:hypothetical protein
MIMKRTLLLLTGIFVFQYASAQKVAKDWSRTACNGIPHHLFDELDSQNIVVLEFVMMNCSPCVTAANGIKKVIAPYQQAHPGRIRLYSIGFLDSYTCEEMTDWQTSNGYTHPVFASGQAEVAYYGGMGMPTIAIVANDSHYVFYKNQGYSSKQDQAIRTAIEAALGTPSGITDHKPVISLNVSPNPVSNTLHINTNLGSNDQLVVTDAAGRTVMVEKASTDLNVSSLQPGVYILNVLNEGRITGRTRFIKSN